MSCRLVRMRLTRPKRAAWAAVLTAAIAVAVVGAGVPGVAAQSTGDGAESGQGAEFDVTEGLEPGTLEGGIESDPGAGAASLAYPNLGARLSALAVAAAAKAVPGNSSESGSYATAMIGLSITFDGDSERVVEAIAAVGGDVRNVFDGYVEALVPPAALAALAQVPGLTWAREFAVPHKNRGRATSGGVAAHLAGAWHAAGFTGAGVKIGVIETAIEWDARDGFTGLRSAMASGDLPATVVGRCYRNINWTFSDLHFCSEPGGRSHGLQVAATVMDMAPDASLYIANPPTWGDLQRSVEWMKNQGVGVIVYANSWPYHGAADGTSPINPSPLNSAKWAADNGIVWVSSAGNYNGKTWFGAFTDADNDNIHEWATGDEYQEFTLNAGQTKPAVFMRWDDTWRGASRDLALLVVKDPGTAQEQVVDSLNDSQRGWAGDKPYEIKQFTAPSSGTYAFVVKKVSGATPGWIQMATFGSLATSTVGHSLLSPADSPHAGLLAVGAASTAGSGIRSYSGLGPTPDGRVKPDIVGADGYVALGGSNYGTSFAAPHVAGLAALVRQQNPAFTAAQTAEYLKTHAVPRGNPFPNNAWGHGFAQLPPFGCVDRLLGDGTVSGTWTTGCMSAVDTQKSSRYYTFAISQQSTVTIDLSSGVDSYLYLRNGYNNQKGMALHTDDNSGTGTDARISESLAAGAYTIEATTASTGQTGAFTLAVSGGLTEMLEVSISAGADITEGGDAIFTLTANPAPPTALTAKVEITADGDWGTTPGTRTVTIPATGTATLTLATTDDSANEPGGSITARLLGDPAYAVSTNANTAAVTVSDDDVPVVRIVPGADTTEGRDARFTVRAKPVPAAALPVRVAITQAGDFGVTPGSHTVTIPTSGRATLNVATTRDSVEEADGSVTATLETGAGYTVSASAGAASVSVKDATPGDACFEHLTGDGTSAGSWSIDCVSHERDRRNARFYTFQLTDPSTVTIELKQSRIDTYLYLRTGKGAWRDQALHENDNGAYWMYNARIRESLAAGWYTIEATTLRPGRTGSFALVVSGLGTAAATPEVSIAAGSGVTEGGDATFTVSAVPAPSAALDVTVAVTAAGDFGVSPGSHTVTVPASGSVALTVATADDSADEADGSVTATVGSGQGYTVSATAGAATVSVADDDDAPCDTADAISRARAAFAWHVDNNGGNEALFWQILAYLGADPLPAPPGGGVLASTSPEAVRAFSDGNGWPGWVPINTAMGCHPAPPVVSVAAGADVGEGGDAVFTVTADPAPSAALDVTVAVAVSGDFGVSPGSRQVTVPASGSVTLSVATANDSADEPDGSVTATVSAGSGYTVSSTAGSTTVAVADDDDPPVVAPEVSIAAGGGVTEGGDAVFAVSAVPAPSAALDVMVAVAVSGDFGVSPGSRTVTVPISGTATLSVSTADDSADEADGSVTATISTGTGYTASATAGSATVAVADDDDPAPVVVDSCVAALSGDGSVSGVWAAGCGSSVRSGRFARFYSFSLDAPGRVTVDLESTADTFMYLRRGVGQRSGAALAFNDDSGGSYNSRISRTLSAGGYTIEATTYRASTAGPFTLTVDGIGAQTVVQPDPEVSVTAGAGVTEGDSATFTITADPAPTAALTVDVTVAQSGDFGVTTGSQSVTVPTSGSVTLTVATADDSADEAHGSVTVTVDTASGYTVSATAGTATVSVADDDPAPVTPEVSITAGSDIDEGGDAVFTVTADPAPSGALDVTVAVAAAGDFGVSPGSRTVTVPTSGTATLTVATAADSADEVDGSVTVTLSSGAGYTVSATASSASVAVADDDAAVCVPSLPSDAVTVSVVTGWRDQYSHAEHQQRWDRVLAALGVDTGETAMTVADAQAVKAQFDNSRWDRTVRTLQAMAQCDNNLPPAADPEVSITAGAGVTEGDSATFTITVDPAPSAALTVDVTVAQTGDYGATTGSRSVTVPTSGSVTLTIATVNDSADEADGSVTVSVDAASGYTVSQSAGTATVAVADDDDPPPSAVDPEVSITAGAGVTEGGDAAFTITADPAPSAALTVDVTVAQTGDYGATTGSRSVTVPTSGSVTLTIATVNDSADEADGSVTVSVDAASGYTVSQSAGTATVAVADDDDPPPVTPEVSITAGAGVTEGGDATFTVTADPAPASPLPVEVTISQSGDFGVSPGSRSVTVPMSGSVTLTVANVNDSTDEADGSVTVTVDAASGYTVSATAGTATVAVADDDDPAPPPPADPGFAVHDATGAEGGTLRVRVTLSGAPRTSKVEVYWMTFAGSGGRAATPGADYSIRARGWLAFDPDDTEKWVQIPLVEDDRQEPQEHFLVRLLRVSPYRTGPPIADGQATMTITDND